MKRFAMMEIDAAVAFANAGGQALHVCDSKLLGLHLRKDAPRCFRESDQFAHLFDLDVMRLTKTARWLGVRKIYVHHRGTERQHIDIVGGPLVKALKKAAEDTARDRETQRQAELLFSP